MSLRNFNHKMDTKSDKVQANDDFENNKDDKLKIRMSLRHKNHKIVGASEDFDNQKIGKISEAVASHFNNKLKNQASIRRNNNKIEGAPESTIYSHKSGFYSIVKTESEANNIYSEKNKNRLSMRINSNKNKLKEEG